MPPRSKACSISLDDLAEKEWAAQIAQVAAQTGFAKYHTYRSKRSPAGFPDEVLVRERIIFVELKREKTKPTDEQIDWLDRLARAGGEVYLWRPSDLEEAGNVLGRRSSFHDGWLLSGEVRWAPRSMWLPGAGRRDGRA